MDSMSAFMRGQAAAGREPRVFDWHKAALLIRERRPSRAGAGLESDWEYTGGEIFKDGAPVPREDTYTYLASTWAAPQLDLDGEVVECWLMMSDTPGWDSHTYWPESALAILRAEAST